MAANRRWHWRRAKSRFSLAAPQAARPLEVVYERRSSSLENIEKRKWFGLAKSVLRPDEPLKS
jgi:hypothetical protein